MGRRQSLPAGRRAWASLSRRLRLPSSRVHVRSRQAAARRQCRPRCAIRAVRAAPLCARMESRARARYGRDPAPRAADHPLEAGKGDLKRPRLRVALPMDGNANEEAPTGLRELPESTARPQFEQGKTEAVSEIEAALEAGTRRPFGPPGRSRAALNMVHAPPHSKRREGPRRTHDRRSRPARQAAHHKGVRFWSAQRAPCEHVNVASPSESTQRDLARTILPLEARTKTRRDSNRPCLAAGDTAANEAEVLSVLRR